MNEAYLDISEGGNIADSWPKMAHGSGCGIHGAGDGISPDWDV